MSPIPPKETIGQRQLSIELAEALNYTRMEVVRRLILENPVGVRSSHVRHNLSVANRTRLDTLLVDMTVEQIQGEGR